MRASKITRSKIPVLVEPLKMKKRFLPMISASSLKNYALDNCLVDYLKYNTSYEGFNIQESDSLTKFI